MQQLVDNIKSNNLQINEMIKKILKQDIKTIIKKDDGNYEFDERFGKIINLELHKDVLTYIAEFSEFLTPKRVEELKATKTVIKEGNEIDAHGYKGTVEFSSGSQEYLDRLYNEEFIPMKYRCDEDGRIRYDENGIFNELDSVDIIGNSGTNHLITEDEMLENNLDFKDYFVVAKLLKYKDVDFFLDAMPHELVHVLGIRGGIFEGLTEGIAREVTNKYGIRAIPVAHGEETRLMYKIEKTIGRDKLFDLAYTGDGKEENIDEISNEIDKAIGLNRENRGLFKTFCNTEDELFLAFKNKKSKSERKEIMQKKENIKENLDTVLDDYIFRNQDKIYSLGNKSKPLSKKEEKDKKEKLNDVLDFQSKEKEFLEYYISMISNLNIEEQDKNKNMSPNLPSDSDEDIAIY